MTTNPSTLVAPTSESLRFGVATGATPLQADGLLPCPNGHDEAKITRDVLFHVECMNHDCPWSVRNFTTAEKARAGWNNRTPSPQEAPAPVRAVAEPVPMVLHCPECKLPHIDRDEWATRLHHTHLCEHCGHQWKPKIATVGVSGFPQIEPDTRRVANGDAIAQLSKAWQRWKAKNGVDPEKDDAELSAAIYAVVKMPTRAQAASAGEPVVVTDAMVMRAMDFDPLDMEPRDRVREILVATMDAAPTDVAAYREVTLEDADELLKFCEHLRTDANDVLIYLRSIHAVIRCPTGQDK